MTTPVLFTWKDSGEGAYLAGSWNHWQIDPMIKVSSGRPFELSVHLKPGLYQYRFIVNGKWQHDKDTELTPNESGTFNNVILVEEPCPDSKKTTETKLPDKKTNERKEKQKEPEEKKPAEPKKQEKPKIQEEAKKEDQPLSQNTEIILAKLAQYNIFPHPDETIDLTAKRPVGHTTHNLFLKDTKSKQLYLISLHQSTNVDLKTVAAKLKSKTLRFASPEDTKSTFGIERGCITSLSLLLDSSHKVISVFDPNILKQSKLCICSGCKDPLDHSQHNVVDISLDLLLEILGESGHGPILMEF